MHELTVAAQIRDGLEREFDASGQAESVSVVVDVVRLRVGALSGIVPEALEFAWPHAVADSELLARAAIEIDFVEVTIDCSSCGAISTTPELSRLRCPPCGSPDVHLLTGNELDIVSVDVRSAADHAPAVAADP